MEKRDLHKIAGFLREQTGLCFAGRREATLRCHVEARAARLGIATGAGYFDLLRNSRLEQGELYSLVTVNETSFFRNPQQFQDLARLLMPRIEQEKVAAGKRRRLRILSAGCSTGEEPYSLAMTLLEAVRYPLAWDLEIVAGDLSDDCLRFAAAGVYQESRLRGLSREYRDKYLRREPEGWVVRDEVKALVRFVKLNLAKVIAGEGIPGVPGGADGFDAIFCRNVLIYFRVETQQLLIEALQRLLAPSGYLFTGDAEPLHLYRHDFETVTAAASLIYRKRGDEAPAAAAVSCCAELAPPAAPAADFLSRGNVETLLVAVADASLGLRDEAMRRLLLLGLPRLAPVLEDSVRNNVDANLRNGAMETLVRFGDEAVPLLVTLLRDRDEEVRNFATVMLGDIGSRIAVPALIEALGDPDANVRHGSAEALGKIGDDRAAEPLLALLDQGFWLQYPAIAALGQLKSRVATPRLLQLLEEELLLIPVARALQQIGDPRAIPALRALALSCDAGRARIARQTLSAIESGGLEAARPQPAAQAGLGAANFR